MKHLKRFNESLTDDEVEELKEFCESSLAYLLDGGYEIDVQREWNVGFHLILRLPGTEDSDEFYWDDVKDYYIPFLQLLSKRYKLGTYSKRKEKGTLGDVYFMGCGKYCQTTYCTVEKVINDDIPKRVDYGVCSINVKVIDKI